MSGPRRRVPHLGWSALFLLPALWAACGKSGDTCSTTQDCLARGDVGATCVNNRCELGCTVDADCRAFETDGAQQTAAGVTKRASRGLVCETGRCVSGCAADLEPATCGANEQCVEGRCLLYFESFEPQRAGDAVLLSARGWNASCTNPRPTGGCGDLENKATKVVIRGVSTCTPADPVEKCAGPAADGENFVSLERQSTPPLPTREVAQSCAACRCCLLCLDATQRTNGETSCQGVTLPVVASCGGTVDPACGSVCQACDACPLRSASEVGMGLDTCEQRAATHTCSSCRDYDACLRANAGPCATQEAACNLCEEAAQAERDFPGDPSRWRAQKTACEAQGGDGCLKVPIALQRNQLSEDEQALESPAVSLAGVSGDVVLSFQYVPYDVGLTFRRVVQGQPRETWPVERQRVQLQFCGGSCADPSRWVDAQRADGTPATIPTDGERQNQLQFTLQSPGDWRSGLVEAQVPEALRTAEFRFRFVPALADGVRVGLDRIRIRRK